MNYLLPILGIGAVALAMSQKPAPKRRRKGDGSADVGEPGELGAPEGGISESTDDSIVKTDGCRDFIFVSQEFSDEMYLRTVECALYEPDVATAIGEYSEWVVDSMFQDFIPGCYLLGVDSVGEGMRIIWKKWISEAGMHLTAFTGDQEFLEETARNLGLIE